MVVLPTDTVYGLVALAADAAALDALRSAKGRGAEVPIAVLVADAGQAAALTADLGDVGRRLAARWWPGPLTLVVQAALGAPDVGGEGTVGVRCPDDAFVRAIADVAGPLAASSANHHGEPTPETAAPIAATFAELLVVDGGPRSSVASTVVDLTVDPPAVLRTGPIDEAAVAAAVAADDR